MEFFAARDDQREILQFLFDESDVRVLELASRPDCELREFETVDEIDAAFALGRARGGRGDALLTLWSPSAMPRMKIRRIDFDRAHVDDARFRYEPEGTGLMQLYFGRAVGGVLTRSHFGHNSPARARKWNMGTGVRWPALQKLSSMIQRHVRRLSVAKVPGRPILPAAAALWRKGLRLKEQRRSPWHWGQNGAVVER